MVALSNEQRERNDAVEAAEADAHLTTGLQDLRRRFDTDPDHATFSTRFQAEADRLRAEASSRISSPSLLRRWSPRADVAISGALDHVLRRGSGLRGEEEFDRLDGALSGLASRYATAADDDARAQIMGNIEQTIELGRRTGIVSPERLRRLRERYIHGSFEGDINARLQAGDGYAALLELREGDPRASAPSSGNVSDLGLSYIQRMLRRPGQPPLTATQAEAELRRLRTEGARVSRWMNDNLVGEDGQRLSLTQLQHDALVGFALRQSQGSGASPQDSLGELMPYIRDGNWAVLGDAIRSGGLQMLDPRAAPGSGLGQAPPTTTGGPQASVGAPQGRDAIGRAVMSYFIGRGLTPQQAAAIAGNMAWEGGGRWDLINPNDNQRGSPNSPHSFGIGQWNDRLPALIAFARQQGVEVPEGNLRDLSYLRRIAPLLNLDVQLGFAWQEMQSTEGRALSGLQGAGDLRSAVGAAIGYHRPAGWTRGNPYAGHGFSDRLALAERFLREGGSPPTGGPPSTSQPDANLGEIGDMVTGQAPSSRYARLPFDRRRVLMRELSQALRTEASTGLESDIASIQATGQPRALPDGTTWLQRATRAGIFTPMQLAQYTRRLREAEARFRALNGLSDMSGEQMADRLDELDTSGVGEGEDYAQAGRVRQFTARAIGRIEQLRRSDPSLWASGTYMLGQPGQPRFNQDGSIASTPAEDDLRVQPAREVMNAYMGLARRYPQLQIQFNEQEGTFTATAAPTPGSLQPDQSRPQTLLLTDPRLTPEDRREIIEARLRAMARVGIAEGDRRILRSDEARALLGLPASLTGMDSTRYAQFLREAADRATTLFGPRYARLAFNTALGFHRLSEDQRRDAQSVVGQLPGGGRDAMTPSEYSLRTAQLSREEALWRYGVPSMPLPEVGEGLPFGPLMGIGAPPTSPQGWFGSSPSPEVPSALTLGASGSDVSEWPMALPPSMQGAPVSPPPSIPPQVRGSGAPGANLQGWPRPTPDLIARLARAPHLQAEFDRTFGPGATAHYLRLFQQSRGQQ